MFCSPVAFFDRGENLIYYNEHQYAQFGLSRTKLWEIVSWSLSGKFAFFIERNSTKTLHYILLDLEGKKVSRTEYLYADEYKWIEELYAKLPPNKAQESCYKIMSAKGSKEAFDYVLTLNLIEDKRELIKWLERYYYSDFKKRLQQFEEGDFDEKIIAGSEFNHFTSVIPDKLKKGILKVIGINNWRPK